MNPWLSTLILAVAQGIGEFLPISSSGHIVILAALMGLSDASAELTIVLHAGTLGSIIVFYWKRIWALLSSDRRVIGLLIWGTIPTAITGITIKLKYPWITESALIAGFALPVTGMMLLLLSQMDRNESKSPDEPTTNPATSSGEYQHMNWWQAVIIGLFQSVALIPGISRSGATIFAGCLVGLRQQSATTFSFLLAIPSILGASLLEFRSIYQNGSTIPIPILIVAAVVAFVVGLISLKLLVHWVARNQLHLFAYWLIPVGMLVVLWQLYLLAK